VSGREERSFWTRVADAFAATAPPPEDFGKSIPDKELLTLKEAAQYLGYTNVESFRRAIREGRSPVKHIEQRGQKYILRYDLIHHLWYSRRR
jgi:hypothetical protein